MKTKKIHWISGVVLYVMLSITMVVACLFYFGGEASENRLVAVDPSNSQPAYTDVFLIWSYILLGIITITAVIASCYRLLSNFINTPIRTVKSLSGILLLFVVMFISWWLGSDKPLILSGYEGTENTPFWSRMADMFLYSIYALVCVALFLILGFAVTRKIK